ncbi:MAG: hypothetical protein H7330_12830 [Hymenobacteraceae bacterium]|nr:hypothetical protein [Hymenobacteraceae bacterium]
MAVHGLNVYIVHDSSFTVRPDSIGYEQSILDDQGQFIGYTTVYAHFNDTTYHVTIRHDSVRTTNQSVRVRDEFRTERRRQDLRPEYRFWTLPLVVQFDIVRRRRWSAGVNVGANLLFFRGGSRPVHAAATNVYKLQRVSTTEGPFRPVSVALSTGLDVRYRLTDRLSLVGGGSARGWAVGPLRATALDPDGPRWPELGAKTVVLRRHPPEVRFYYAAPMWPLVPGGRGRVETILKKIFNKKSGPRQYSPRRLSRVI